jgi:hypothetical protein
MDPAGMTQHNQHRKATDWHQVYTTGYRIARWRHLKQKQEERGFKEKLSDASLSILHSYDSKRSHVNEREAILRAVLDKYKTSSFS